ncbi:unnamed protein product, partial [Mesorhabditis spiculigera]
MRLHALAACEEKVYAEDWKGHMAATTLAGKPCGVLPVLFYESGRLFIDDGGSIEESFKEMDVIGLNQEAKNIYAALPEMKLKRDAAPKALAEARKTYEFQDKHFNVQATRHPDDDVGQRAGVDPPEAPGHSPAVDDREFDEMLDNLSTRSAMTSTSTASIAHTPQRVESLIDVDPTVHPMLDDSLLLCE